MMHYNAALVLLIVAMAAPALVVLAGAIRVRWASPVAVAVTALAFGVTLVSCWQGDARIDVAWAPAWDIRFTLELDGLARLYALLATGIGLAVVIYAAAYLPLHLHHGHRRPGEIIRFYGFLLLFMGAMVGLVMSQDFILLFVFWDLTAIASFFLIGYDREEDTSRAAALMALLVTGISAVLVLIGALLLWHETGTFDLPDILAGDLATTPVAIAAALIAIGALAKSAQVPLHFWLPNAMAAPTPVSAYLHSAAMVAAGVFLIGRVYPLIERFEWLLHSLLIIGLLSMAAGGAIALTRDVLKQILAYSTISQYGYVVFLFGIGGEHAVAAASFYVIAHAIAKSALFLTAGAVTEVTGSKNLSGVRGLARKMPLLAVGSGLAAAGLIALPLTLGFFKDEFFFAAAWERGPLFGIAAVGGATLTFTYISRFWLGMFGTYGTESPVPERSYDPTVPPLLLWPVVVLGGIMLFAGWWMKPLLTVAEEAASVSMLTPVHLHAAYHFDTRAENLMAIATWICGGLLLAGRKIWWNAAVGIARLGRRFGPEHGYHLTMLALNRLSDRIHVIEVRDLRSRIATILLPAGVLVGLAVWFTPNSSDFEVGTITQDDWPVVLMLIVTMVAAFAVLIPREHLRLALVLSCVGYSLSVIYAFIGAPDVAIVAILMETMFTLLFIGMLILMPRAILRYETARRPERFRIRRDAIMAGIAGIMAFFVVWGALSKPSAEATAIGAYIELAPLVHGKDVVTVILAEFRGLDTMGEITVISIALLGFLSLLRVGRMR
jgi:multicomponent Na+:H+ antiporter subunit A